MKCRGNMILHEIFSVASRFLRYISYYIAENRLPLGQCIIAGAWLVTKYCFKKISKVSFLSWRPFLVCRWKRQKKFFLFFWAHSNKLNQKNRGRENRIKKSKKIISKQKPEVALNWVVMRLNSLFSSSSHVMVTKYDFCRVTIAKVKRYFKIVFGPFSASFSLYFVVTVRLTVNKNRRWLDLNRGSLWSNCSSNCATTTAHNEYNF